MSGCARVGSLVCCQAALPGPGCAASVRVCAAADRQRGLLLTLLRSALVGWAHCSLLFPSLSRAVVTYSADRLKPNKKKTFKGHLVAGARGSWLPAAAVRLPVDPVIRLYPPVIRLYPPVLCCCCRRL